MNEFLIVAGVHLLAVMSPGPDFAMVLKNSLSHGRKSGIWSAAGLGLGILVHVAYSIVGIGLVISQSIVLFNTIKLLGAAYLIYIGIKALLAKKHKNAEKETDTKNTSSTKEISGWRALKTGFLTNVLNPKATLFFLSLFTQVISPNTNDIVKILYGVEMSLATFAWFSLVALLLTQKPVRLVYERVKHHLDRVFGVVLVALGIKVALSQR